MKKTNMSDVQESGGFNAPKADGYICGIYDIIEKEEYELFEVYLDIIEGDLKGYYKKSVDGGFRKTLAKITLFYKDGNMSTLKSFLTSVENSNTGVKIDIKAIDTDTVMKTKGKKVGMVFREREYEANGVVKTTVEPFQPHSVKSIKEKDFKLIDKKCLAQSTAKVADDPFKAQAQVQQTTTTDGFVNIPDGIDEELPFDLDFPDFN